MHSLKPTYLIAAIWLGLSCSEMTRSADDAAQGSELERLCPQAAAERKQLLSQRRVIKDVVAVSRPALRADLLQMLKEDQNARQKLVDAMKEGRDLPDDDPYRKYAIQVDDRNLRRLKHVISQDGVPTI